MASKPAMDGKPEDTPEQQAKRTNNSLKTTYH